jgi:hypothetical protein
VFAGELIGHVHHARLKDRRTSAGEESCAGPNVHKQKKRSLPVVSRALVIHATSSTAPADRPHHFRYPRFSRSMAGLVLSSGPFIGWPVPDDESAVPNELVPGAVDWHRSRHL